MAALGGWHHWGCKLCILAHGCEVQTYSTLHLMYGPNSTSPRRQWLGGALSLLFLSLAAGCAPANPTAPQPSPSATPTDPPTTAPSPTPAPSATAEAEGCEAPLAEATVRFDPTEWLRTDFCQHSVEYEEIFGGGSVAPDSIPPIDDPKFVAVNPADEWLSDGSPVILFELEGAVRVYPLSILIWHEVVNDTVAGEPILITYCPLCNSAVAFKRTLPDGEVLRFGTTGVLRNSNLIMYDRGTQSWWQQITGEAIVGELTGARLEVLPAQTVKWETVVSRWPEAQVLSTETGYDRQYGSNPYVGYDRLDSSPRYRLTNEDDRLLPKARVATVNLNGEQMAFPFNELSEARVANAVVGGEPIVVFWEPGARSAVNAGSVRLSREVGSVGAFRRTVENRELTFTFEDGAFRDEESGSIWTILGSATEGELAGEALEPVVVGEHFWFAWAAFYPETGIWEP